MTLPDYLQRVARDYDAAEHSPSHLSTLAHYATLKRELWNQYRVLEAFTRVTFTTTDPYGSSREMFESLDRGSLSVYSVADLPNGHPFSEVAPNGQLFNTIFRAVHDGFAHYPERNSFGMVGEYRAFLAHCRLLSYISQLALFTETVGQNAWYHFGPRAHETPKPFAEQKAVILSPELFAASLHVTL